MNNRWINLLAVLLFIFSSTAQAFAPKKNTLLVHFETAKVKESVTDIVLNVTYKIQALRSPVNFRGYECRFSYEKTKISPVTTFFDGTASQYGSGGGNNISSTGEYRIELLSGLPLDTSNHVLFQVRYSVKKALSDSAMIEPIRFDAVDSSIDTVIIDNAPGRDQVSWYPFGLVFRDTTKPPPPPKKVDITFSSSSANVQSDSILTIPINVTSLDNANIKNGIFEFDLDTAAFDSVAVKKGLLLANAAMTVGHDTSHMVVSFTKTDSILGSGEFLKILLRGKKRTDTLCSGIVNPKFTALNDDNLLASAAFTLQNICVQGAPPKDTVKKGISDFGKNEDLTIKIFPNPASSFIDFRVSPESVGSKHLVVFDALGRRILDRVVDASLRWEVAMIPAGLYTATVTDFSAFHGSMKAQKTKILIVH